MALAAGKESVRTVFFLEGQEERASFLHICIIMFSTEAFVKRREYLSGASFLALAAPQLAEADGSAEFEGARLLRACHLDGLEKAPFGFALGGGGRGPGAGD